MRILSQINLSFYIIILVFSSGCKKTSGTETKNDVSIAPEVLDLFFSVPVQACVVTDPTLQVAGLDRYIHVFESNRKPSQAEIAEMANTLGVNARVDNISIEQLAQRKDPAILFDEKGNTVAIIASKSDSRFLTFRSNQRISWEAIPQLSPLLERAAVLLEPKSRMPGGALIPLPPIGQNDLGTFTALGFEDRQIFLVNRGSVQVNITSAELSCGCGKIKRYDTEVAPGQVAETWLTFDMRKRLPGKLNLTLLLGTRTTGQSELECKLKGNVLEGIALSPALYHTGTLPPTREVIRVTSRLTFPSNSIADLKPKQADPGLHWQEPIKITDGAYDIQADLIAAELVTDSNEQFSASLIIATGHPSQAEVTLMVTGRRTPWISVHPQQIFLGSEVGGSIVKRTLSFTAYEDKLPIELVPLDKSVSVKQVDGRLEVSVTLPATIGQYESGFDIVVGKNRRRVPIIATVN